MAPVFWKHSKIKGLVGKNLQGSRTVVLSVSTFLLLSLLVRWFDATSNLLVYKFPLFLFYLCQSHDFIHTHQSSLSTVS